jgi:hypothetical protein
VLNSNKLTCIQTPSLTPIFWSMSIRTKLKSVSLAAG